MEMTKEIMAMIGANLVLVLRNEKHTKETNEMIKAIQEEIRDFHNRLYSLEERTRTTVIK